MRKVRIAQIGVNRYSHATEVFGVLKKHPELFDIAGYAVVEDEEQTCAHKLKAFEGYSRLSVEAILSDPEIEAVVVETDEIHLTKYATMAARAGKHIHMEKPGSQDPCAFEALIEEVKASGKVFHVGYMYRYNPFVAQALARAKRGELGHIYSVEALMSRPDPRESREWFGTFKGGMMFYLGCHLVDLVLQIQGVPDRVVPFNTRTGIEGVMTEDLGFAVLQYPHAVSVVRMGGTEIGGADRRQLVLCAEKETLEIRPLEVQLRPYEACMLYTERVQRRLCENGETTVRFERSEPFHRYEAMMLAFASMVRGERENPYTPEYELQLFKTVLKCCGM